MTSLKRLWAHYKEVLYTSDATLVVSSGMLILISWLVQIGVVGPSWFSPALAVAAAALAGWPILGGALKGVREKQVNAD